MPDTKTKKSGQYKWLLLLLVVLVIVILRFSPLSGIIYSLISWIRSQGIWGYALFFLFYVAACVFVVPGSILTLGAGFAYGLVTGTILVSVSSTVGAVAAFLVGRYFARDKIKARIMNNPKFESIDKAVGKSGFKIVLLTRLSPIFPFNILNYAYGLTAVTLREYFLASWIGMLPGTVMYVYIGTLITDLSTSAVKVHSPYEIWLKIVGFVATAAVTLVIAKMARKALTEKVE